MIVGFIGCEITYFKVSFHILRKILLCKAESYGHAGVSGRVVVVVGHEGVGHVTLEEGLCTQALAEGVVGGEVDVDLVLAGRHLVVVLVDAAQHGDVYFTADYNFSQRLGAQAFFKYDVTNPFVANNFRTSTTYGGITLRFSLAQ